MPDHRPLARRALFLLAALLWLAPAAIAQEPAAPQPRAVRVGLYISPPFVMEQNGRYTGMAVELWEAVAGRLGLTSEYQVLPSIRALVDAAAARQIDVAVTNLTITQRRAERIDFTHPWYDAGLRIMVDKERGAGFWDVIEGLSDSGHLTAYAWIALVIAAATLLLTLFDRAFDPAFPRRWRDGVAESFHEVMTVATSGKASHKNLFGWAGRIFGALWLVCGVAVLAYVTSSVTSVMTTLALTSEIDSAADLPGRTVGVFTGSVAEDFAGESGLAARAYDHIDEAVAALRGGEIDAIVGDAPVLEYYAHSHPDVPLDVVGPIFEPDKYGFGLTHRSELTRPLTVEVIGAHERDVIAELREKYFGAEE